MDDFISMRADRGEIRKPIEKLGSQRQFEGTPRSRDDNERTTVGNAVCSKPQDNIRLQAYFEGSSRNRDDFNSACGYRAEIKKPIDTLPLNILFFFGIL
jgi:hypothetical protein